MKRQPLPTAPADRFRTQGVVETAGERFRSAPLGSHFRAWAKRAYYAALMFQTGGRGLSCMLPDGERIRALPEHRYLSWNPQEYAAFKRAVSPGMVALDIGANVGAYSMLLGQWVRPAGSRIRVRTGSSGIRRSGPARPSERVERRRPAPQCCRRGARDTGRVPDHEDVRGRPSGCARRSRRRPPDRARRHG